MMSGFWIDNGRAPGYAARRGRRTAVEVPQPTTRAIKRPLQRAAAGRPGGMATTGIIAQSPPSLTVIEKFHRSINFNSTDKWIKTPP
jgi:hypothetical protein